MEDYKDEPWSPYNICGAHADHRGYLIARTGAPDVHRAGLEILHECLDGKIAFCWPPPDYVETQSDSAAQNANSAQPGESDPDQEKLRAEKAAKRQEKKRKQKNAATLGIAMHTEIPEDVGYVPRAMKGLDEAREEVDDLPAWKQKLNAKEDAARAKKRHQ